MNSLNVVSCNISGLKDDTKRKAVWTYLRENNFDIVFLQETHCHLKKDEKKWALEWDGQSLWSRGTNRSRGVSVLFNRRYRYDIRNESIDYSGRYIVFDLCINDKRLRFINIYSPNNEYDRVCFINSLSKWIEPEIETIIAGDYNCVLDSKLDRMNCCGSKDVGQIDIMNMMNTFNLEDVWRRRNPQERLFSWRRGNKASRIDYFLISNVLDNNVDYVNYDTCPFSDHSYVKLQLRLNDTDCGKGAWKMNVNTIQSDLFKKCFINMWTEWQSKKHEYNDIRIWWDLGKKKIKDLCIWCSCKINEDRNFKSSLLENRLKILQTKENASYDEIKSVKNELKRIYDVKGEGTRVRSRVNWFEKGETSTTYFHGLEKRNFKNKLWNCVLSKDGKKIYGTDNIMNRHVEFYKELYTSEGIDLGKAEAFIDCIDKQLSHESSTYLDQIISIDEISKSLKLMKNNKSPGPDGIIVEFYKLFWNNVRTDIKEVFDYSFTYEQLPYSQYMALITLLYKKGQREDIKNWRPISLLNCDGKMLSKVLAERLKRVLKEIIHLDQQGCIPGRYVGQNIRLVEDIIQNHNDDEVVVLLDQQKAFDRVEWQWLFKVLDKFNFGPNFKKWIEIMYKDMKSSILTNGFVSKCFPVKRGIRQGDSLSALLYIIQSEPFAENIRKNTDLQGIVLKNEHDENVECKCCMYVDDGVIFLKHVNSLDKCYNVIKTYEEASGAKLNMDKTVGIVMKESLVRPCNVDTHEIRLTTGPEKCLGVVIGKNVDKSEYWENIITKLKNNLQVWKMRNLSLQGKVYLIRSIGISTVLYACEMTYIPEYYIDKIEKLLYEFLWDGKKAKVRKQICTLPQYLGGINMPDIKTIVKVKRIKWIIRFLKSSAEDKWSIYPRMFFQRLDKRFGAKLFMLQVNDIRDIIENQNIPSFYHECVIHLHEMYRKSKVIDEYETLWYNSKIKFMCKPLALSHWSKDGLTYVSDVVFNGKIDESTICNKLSHKAAFVFEISKIKCSIPDTLKNIDYRIRDNDMRIEDSILKWNMHVPNEGMKSIVDLTSKDIYNVMLLNVNVHIKSKDYWSRKFDSSNIDFDKWFKCNFTCKLTPRNCIDFNWKLFYGQVNTEQRLKKMKYSNGICLLCKAHDENVEHLLLKCCHVKHIWKSIQNLLLLSDIDIYLSTFNIICGYHDFGDKSKICNVILSITRFIIWKRRNLLRYEDTFLDIDKTEKWVYNEIRKHCTVLLFTSSVKKNKTLQSIIEKVKRKCTLS